MASPSKAPTFGFLVPTHAAISLGRPEAPPLVKLGVRAETLGFDALWLADSPHIAGLHDPLLMLAALATRTSRATLGTAVLLAALRDPRLLAQSVATLDRLAEGRLVLGLGSGFGSPATRHQFESLGIPFDTRVGRLTEAIELMRAVWAAGGRPVGHAGRHFAFESLGVSPPPHTPGGPPIWLAGAGDAAEARVGRLADGWLPYLRTPQLWAQGWERVRAAAAAAGRDAPPTGALYLTIALDAEPEVAQERLEANVERWYRMPLSVVGSIQATYAGPPEGLCRRLAEYVEAGVEHVVLRVADEDLERGLEEAAAAVAMFREPAGAAP